jgi:hypothetical protein
MIRRRQRDEGAPVAPAVAPAAAPESDVERLRREQQQAVARAAEYRAALDEIAGLMEAAIEAKEFDEQLALRRRQLQAFHRWQKAAAEAERFETKICEAQSPALWEESQRLRLEHEDLQKRLREAEIAFRRAIGHATGTVNRGLAAEERAVEIERARPPAFEDPYAKLAA